MTRQLEDGEKVRDLTNKWEVSTKKVGKVGGLGYQHKFTGICQYLKPE